MLLALLLSFTVPSYTGLVNDQAHMLTSEQIQQLESKLEAYEGRTTNEVAVLIVPSLNGESVENYANQTFHAWGIGKKGKDNGVLFVWSVSEHKLRIEVGYGLESVLPDGRAGDIIRAATPSFRAQQWNQGVSSIIDGIIAQLDYVKPTPAVVVQPTQASDSTGAAIVLGSLLFVVFGGFGVFLYLNLKRKAQREAELRAQAARIRAATDYVQHPRRSVLYPVTQPRREAPVRHEEEHHTFVPVPTPTYEAPSTSYEPSSSSWDSGGGFGGFGGGDSGGGGASGSY